MVDGREREGDGCRRVVGRETKTRRRMRNEKEIPEYQNYVLKTNAMRWWM